MLRLPSSPSAGKSRRLGPRRRHRAQPWLVYFFLLVTLSLGAACALVPGHGGTAPMPAAPASTSGGTVGPAPTTIPTAGLAATPATRVQPDVPSVTDRTPGANPAAAAVPAVSLGDAKFAFLLMGYEGSEGGFAGEYNTDSMMVAIVDPAHQTIALLSVPRDSWVPMYFNGATAVYNKVNTAYGFALDPNLYPDRLARYTGSQGAGSFADDTVSRLLGIPLTYYAAVDFQGFRDMVDAVGGIDVNVPDAFTTLYPKNDDPSIDASWITLKFTAGLQHMDGERALEYARSREVIDNPSEGTDFARSRRQRLIMEAFKNRLLQPGGLIHLPALISIATQHLDTNYTIPDLAHLSQLILGWKNVKIYDTALTTSNYLEDGTGPDGTYVAVPNSPEHSWAQIRAFARHLWANPAAGEAMGTTTIVVENDTNVNGLAGRVSAALAAMGYQVGTPISGPLNAQTRVVDETGGSAAQPLIHQVEADLGLPSLPVNPPPTAGDPASPQIVLQLGQDEADLAPTVPSDPQAPFSTDGIIKFGIWPYTPPTPTPVRAPVEAASRLGAYPTPERRPVAPGADASPTAAAAGTAEVVVPSLIGLSEVAAQHLILQDGLMTTYVNYQTYAQVADHRYFLSIPPDHVLSQAPAPGLKVPRGTRVLLAVRAS
jgi:LCP family protein required for cell wall assembly